MSNSSKDNNNSDFSIISDENESDQGSSNNKDKNNILKQVMEINQIIII